VVTVTVTGGEGVFAPVNVMDAGLNAVQFIPMFDGSAPAGGMSVPVTEAHRKLVTVTPLGPAKFAVVVPGVPDTTLTVVDVAITFTV
jgi:hypothetical protein